MKCKNCGASLLDTDKFCAQCGWKVVRQRRCPECGAALREGTKFCPKCGRLIGGKDADDEGKVFVKDDKTTDIPIADIEQNILSETERELHTVKKPHPAPAPKKKKKPEPVKKKVYEKWDDEDDEDDEDDDADTGGSFMVIVTVVMALLIITIAAMLVFVTLRSRPIKNYGASVEENDNEAEDGDVGSDGELEVQESNGADGNGTDSEQPIGTISIISDVRVRDNPSTEGTNIIKVAKEGETYEYLGTEQDGDWYRILLEDGSTGYVFAKYVSVN